ncbi:MAG TPA: fatty acid--CoA ligase family protein, partial [Actinomycetota bacterium]|nr:fatty acid--CoA ligase family protein [Actinomycetota bacterium]
ARPTVLVSSEGRERRADGLPAESDVVLVVPTSGTGGEPKLVQFDRAAIETAVAASAQALEATSQDRWLCCLPLAHIGGLLILLRGVLLRAPVIVHPGFDTEAVAAVRDVAFTSVVPTMLVRLLDAGVDLSGFRAILVGGANLSPDIRERAQAVGAHLVETYGLTESCGGVVYEGLPLPGVQVRIDAEGGIELAGPMLMLGYRFDAEGTARAFTPDGWLRPGDAGEIDPQGRLHVIGRVDDLINSGGENVWPQEVEAALRTHPKVGDVLVRGRPDPEWGQRVVAWVVAADPADPPTLEELRAHAALRLARHKVPRELVPVQVLLRTPAGKPRTAGLPDRE